MKVNITKAQLEAIIEIVEETKAHIGGAEDDRDRIKWCRLADRFIANARKAS